MMAGMTGAFADALNRKYSNLETNTRGENELRDAQAGGIINSQASENALRNSQADAAAASGRAQDEATKYVGPLANAQIGFQGAQGGLFGAEVGQINYGFAPADDAILGNLHRQTTDNNYGLDAAAGIGVARRPGYSYTSPLSGRQSAYGQTGSISSVTSANPTGQQYFSAGTSDVQPKGAPMASTPGVPAPLPPVGTDPVQQGMGLFDHMHGIVTHAMHALHAAGGATTVQPTPQTPVGQPPAPGQTQTNGQWGPGQNQTLRDRLGYGVKASGGMTEVDASGGASKVPGKGNPGVDKVPAVLAPGEAVLNAGAATHMGRGAIAALNALGAHSMAMAGTPPQGPGAGPQMGGPPMGGPPAQSAPMGGDKTMKPIARGMPKPPPGKSASKPTGKTPPPKAAKSPMSKGKVAAGGKGK